MTAGEIFLTVFVAFLAGAVVYLGFAVRELQRVPGYHTPPPPLVNPDSERIAQEWLERQGRLREPQHAWPYDADVDPATTMPADFGKREQ